jgi:hypothetical protein
VHGSSARRDFLADEPLGRGSFFVVVDGTTMAKNQSMTASLQCAQCKRLKTQQKLHDVLKYDLFWRV